MPKRNGMVFDREAAAVRRALRALEKSLVGLATARRTASDTGVRATRRLSLSPARLRALKLHGRRLDHIRQLKPRQRTLIDHGWEP